MFRINVNPTDDFILVLEQLAEKLAGVDPHSISISNKPSGADAQPANSLCGKSVELLGLKNGDMLFLKYESIGDKQAEATNTTTLTGNTPSGSITVKNISPVKQDLEVDKQLAKEDGLIKRPQSRYCGHGANGMCDNCSPLPPWDPEYQKENNIKHISFHARLKELNNQRNNKHTGLSYIAPLEEPDYRIDLNCHQGHNPYPKGICSKCQPAPITLQQQKFRMVDHVEYSDFHILNRFIDAWRSTGVQRFGILYGRYEKFDKVPLGIKAVVEAIYEPKQAGEADGLVVLTEEEEMAQVDDIAKKLGLTQVGVVFTDLTDSGRKDGTVLCKRHKDSYFLTNLEILMAARNQISHANTTSYSNSGQFLSKYITSVVSGGLAGEIEPRSYQVSVEAEALVRADMLTGSTQPSELYVNGNTDKRYVPDISYLKTNEYNLQVKKTAKPTLPVEFLLVSLSDSFPMDPKPFFTSPNGFTIENRDFMGDLQDLNQLKRHLLQGNDNGELLVDFHLLVALRKLSVLSDSEFDLLLKFVESKQLMDFYQLVETPGWMTLLTILEHS